MPPALSDNDGSDIRAVWPFKAFADPRVIPAPHQFPLPAHRDMAKVMEDEK